MKYAQTLALFLSAASCAELEDNSVVAHSTSLKCGRCVKGGFNYCMQKKDAGEMDTIVADAAAIPRGSCCEDDKCAEASNDLYTCSLTYEDPEMAMSFCPQRKDSCGSTSEFQKDATSDAVSEVEITGMTTGESCSYKVKSCGASPAFKLKDSSTCDNKKVNITYLEFNEKKVNMTGGKLDKKQTNKIEDSGRQGNSTKGGQQKPQRKKKDGSMTKNESVDAEKKAVDEQKKNKKKKEDQEKENEGFRPFKKDEEEVVVDVKEKPKEGESISETEAVAGYGEPTKGAYDATEKGFKTFGTEGQGKDKEGLKGEKSDKKDCRQMRVSVTAVDDQATDTILLEIGAYDFIEEYEWVEEGSSKLALAFSSLVAASFFMI